MNADSHLCLHHYIRIVYFYRQQASGGEISIALLDDKKSFVGECLLADHAFHALACMRSTLHGEYSS
jgi:hypothetical protein